MASQSGKMAGLPGNLDSGSSLTTRQSGLLSTTTCIFQFFCTNSRVHSPRGEELHLAPFHIRNMELFINLYHMPASFESDHGACQSLLPVTSCIGEKEKGKEVESQQERGKAIAKWKRRQSQNTSVNTVSYGFFLRKELQLSKCSVCDRPYSGSCAWDNWGWTLTSRTLWSITGTDSWRKCKGGEGMSSCNPYDNLGEAMLITEPKTVTVIRDQAYYSRELSF